ncbi:MAG: hypothetical protein V1816_00740 [Pseudomonadota bacterium]
MGQFFVVLLIVAAAVFFLAWKVKNVMRGKSGGCCGGGSCHCSSASSGLSSLGGPNCPGAGRPE